MSPRRLPTLRDAMIGMSVVPQRKYKAKAQSRYRRRYVKKKVRYTLDEEGRETKPVRWRRRGIFHRDARTHVCICTGRVKRESGASVPKGSGGRSDGGTVVVVAEQRGVTWGVYDLEPRTRRVAKAKVCRVYKARNRRQSASSSLLDAPGTPREQKWESWYVLRAVIDSLAILSALVSRRRKTRETCTEQTRVDNDTCDKWTRRRIVSGLIGVWIVLGILSARVFVSFQLENYERIFNKALTRGV